MSGVTGAADERGAGGRGVRFVRGTPERAPGAILHLTPRQVEVWSAGAGPLEEAVAAELHLSTDTVRNDIRCLLRVLGVNSRVEAVPRRVVHGRGTGAMRAAVREELARHTLVGSHEPGWADGASLVQLG